MFVNCSNHPSTLWNSKQLEAAGKYGKIEEIPFPSIDPDTSPENLRELTDEYAARIEKLKPGAVFVAGEFTFTFMLVDRLLSDGINVVCSRSRRITAEKKNEDGTNEKTAVFIFDGFYKYEYYFRRNSEKR